MGSEVGEVSRGTGIGWFGTSSLLDARGERIIAPKKTENNFRLFDNAKSNSCDLHDYTLPPPNMRVPLARVAQLVLLNYVTSLICRIRIDLGGVWCFSKFFRSTTPPKTPLGLPHI